MRKEQQEPPDLCMIKIFRGGSGGGWGGGSSERCLNWGWWGSLRDLSKNILKQGVGKGKSYSKGEGVLKVSPPLTPQKILIIHFIKFVKIWSEIVSRIETKSH